MTRYGVSYKPCNARFQPPKGRRPQHLTFATNFFRPSFRSAAKHCYASLSISVSNVLTCCESLLFTFSIAAIWAEELRQLPHHRCTQCSSSSGGISSHSAYLHLRAPEQSKETSRLPSYRLTLILATDSPHNYVCFSASENCCILPSFVSEVASPLNTVRHFIRLFNGVVFVPCFISDPFDFVCVHGVFSFRVTRHNAVFRRAPAAAPGLTDHRRPFPAVLVRRARCC